jgi:hypothetical protein
MENQTHKSSADRAMARRQMVERYQSSGKSQREFCEEEGTSLSTLQWWMRKARGGAELVAMALREVDWPAGPALTPDWNWSARAAGRCGIVRRWALWSWCGC